MDRSVPVMWLMQSLTVQPGSSVGVFHSDSSSSSSNVLMLAHSVTSCSTTASLMSAGRDGEPLDVRRGTGFDASCAADRRLVRVVTNGPA